MATKFSIIMPVRLTSEERRFLKQASRIEDRPQAWLIRDAIKKCYGENYQARNEVRKTNLKRKEKT